jgi:hypothetical protein
MKNATKEDIEQSIQHVAFEFYHFEFCRRIVELAINGQRPVSPPVLYQAIGYQFLIHFRSLLDFFYKESGEPDDLTANDFVLLPGFLASFGKPSDNRPAWLQAVRTHLNKRLAHITSPRWKEPAMDMNGYFRFSADVRDLITKFKSSLPPDLQLSTTESYQKFRSMADGLSLV